jgi:hypothetical protein
MQALLDSLHIVKSPTMQKHLLSAWMRHPHATIYIEIRAITA